ncbi:MAG: EF-P lysine aminoacylase EpmA [Porticoccaceae bacterium]
MLGTDWQPSASLATLKKRAELLAQIRSFFSHCAVMEVDTPILGRRGVTDLHIDCVQARVCGETRYMQSSPEYFMKRLLAAGAGAIYSLGKVFRDEEQGSRHRPEFTLLEWYRPGWDEYQLMAEVETLILSLAAEPLPVTRVSYGSLFESVTGLDPHAVDDLQLQEMAAASCGGDWRMEDRSTVLDVLFSMVVEPRLPPGLVFIHQYPACQAALAQLDRDGNGNSIARRFELFLNRMELGNGYFELTDTEEQRQRFAADNALRQAAAKPQMIADEALLEALAAGLPSCAGVALGVDRLLMALLHLENIGQVVAFDG